MLIRRAARLNVTLECKLVQGSSDMYVQDVKAVPFPVCHVFRLATE